MLFAVAVCMSRKSCLQNVLKCLVGLKKKENVKNPVVFLVVFLVVCSLFPDPVSQFRSRDAFHVAASTGTPVGP